MDVRCPVPVDEEIAAAPEQDAQLGEGGLAGLELAEVGPHASLIGDDAGISGIGLAVGASIEAEGPFL